VAQAVQQWLASDADTEGITDVGPLAHYLNEKGFITQVKIAVGGGPDCLRNLQHTFISCSHPGEVVHMWSPVWRCCKVCSCYSCLVGVVGMSVGAVMPADVFRGCCWLKVACCCYRMMQLSVVSSV
jgi:hypothetical protein